MRLKRETVEALLFGGTEAQRFTQDTPILPDVWMAYAEKETPDDPSELILTPYQDSTGRASVTSGLLASALVRS